MFYEINLLIHPH